VCSSGECIEIADAIREARGYKRISIQVLCRLADVFFIQEYNQCLVDYLGEEIFELQQ
jgi:hypothetical protein